MANPQKENGYVPIANELSEAFAKIRIAGEAWQIINVVLRKTYGFNKKADAISLSQFVLATGMSKTRVCQAISKLISMNIITKKGNYVANIYSLNKDFSTWKSLPKKVTLPKKEISITEKGNNHYQKQDIQKTVSKDTITKDISEVGSSILEDGWPGFEKLWKQHPRKENKRLAQSAYNRLMPNHSLRSLILDRHKLWCESPQWQKDNGQFVPLLSNWLEGRRWEDEVKVIRKTAVAADIPL